MKIDPKCTQQLPHTAIGYNSIPLLRLLIFRGILFFPQQSFFLWRASEPPTSPQDKRAVPIPKIRGRVEGRDSESKEEGGRERISCWRYKNIKVAAGLVGCALLLEVAKDC